MGGHVSAPEANTPAPRERPMIERASFERGSHERPVHSARCRFCD
jgi:hypothetical protein